MQLAILYQTITMSGTKHELVRSIFPVGDLNDDEKEELRLRAEQQNYQLKFRRILLSDDIQNMIGELESFIIDNSWAA